MHFERILSAQFHSQLKYFFYQRMKLNNSLNLVKQAIMYQNSNTANIKTQ